MQTKFHKQRIIVSIIYLFVLFISYGTYVGISKHASFIEIVQNLSRLFVYIFVPFLLIALTYLFFLIIFRKIRKK